MSKLNRAARRAASTTSTTSTVERTLERARRIYHSACHAIRRAHDVAIKAGLEAGQVEKWLRRAAAAAWCTVTRATAAVRLAQRVKLPAPRAVPASPAGTGKKSCTGRARAAAHAAKMAGERAAAMFGAVVHVTVECAPTTLEKRRREQAAAAAEVERRRRVAAEERRERRELLRAAAAEAAAGGSVLAAVRAAASEGAAVAETVAMESRGRRMLTAAGRPAPKAEPTAIEMGALARAYERVNAARAALMAAQAEMVMTSRLPVNMMASLERAGRLSVAALNAPITIGATAAVTEARRELAAAEGALAALKATLERVTARETVADARVREEMRAEGARLVAHARLVRAATRVNWARVAAAKALLQELAGYGPTDIARLLAAEGMAVPIGIAIAAMRQRAA